MKALPFLYQSEHALKIKIIFPFLFFILYFIFRFIDISFKLLYGLEIK